MLVNVRTNAYQLTEMDVVKVSQRYGKECLALTWRNKTPALFWETLVDSQMRQAVLHFWNPLKNKNKRWMLVNVSLYMEYTIKKKTDCMRLMEESLYSPSDVSHLRVRAHRGSPIMFKGLCTPTRFKPASSNPNQLWALNCPTFSLGHNRNNFKLTWAMTVRPGRESLGRTPPDLNPSIHFLITTA